MCVSCVFFFFPCPFALLATEILFLDGGGEGVFPKTFFVVLLFFFFVNDAIVVVVISLGATVAVVVSFVDIASRAQGTCCARRKNTEQTEQNGT